VFKEIITKRLQSDVSLSLVSAEAQRYAAPAPRFLGQKAQQQVYRPVATPSRNQKHRGSF